MVSIFQKQKGSLKKLLRYGVPDTGRHMSNIIFLKLRYNKQRDLHVLVKSIGVISADIGVSSAVKSAATDAGPGSSGQGQRRRRPSWVSADEAVASRTDTRGRGNFRGKWRGKASGHPGRRGGPYAHRGNWGPGRGDGGHRGH
jgi:hypothetical protein